mmetsp:Transcript_17762/g.36429  ORF Transcript_17762/g.36429 Transcript_17762/m.36429 type:complete len:89 (+) Transcript_17762:146-412(+)
MCFRFSLRRHGSFSTRKHKLRVSRTPGKRNSSLFLKKKTGFVICGVKKTRLNGIRSLNLIRKTKFPKSSKKISRAYGGCLSGKAVKER